MSIRIRLKDRGRDCTEGSLADFRSIFWSGSEVIEVDNPDPRSFVIEGINQLEDLPANQEIMGIDINNNVIVMALGDAIKSIFEGVFMVFFE